MYLHYQIRGIGLNGPCLGRLAEAEEGGSDREGLGNSGRKGTEGRGSAVKALAGAGHYYEAVSPKQEDSPPSAHSLRTRAGGFRNWESRGGLGS